MQTNDQKALTYTSPPLQSDTEVTGHPIATLCFVTDASDLDFFVYLEEVKSSESTYVTEGSLRASHRALAKLRSVTWDCPTTAITGVTWLPFRQAHRLSLRFTSFRFRTDSRKAIVSASPSHARTRTTSKRRSLIPRRRFGCCETRPTPHTSNCLSFPSYNSDGMKRSVAPVSRRCRAYWNAAR